MIQRITIAAIVVSIAAIAAPTALAQGTSEAIGRVTDREGNPVQGAKVIFVPQGNPTLKYDGETNKKGRYFIPGLFTPKENDRWDITLEAEGYLPVTVTIESRNVNRVLIGDILEQNLAPGQKVPDIIVRPLGTAKVEFIVATREEIEAERRAMLTGSTGLPQAGPPASGEDAPDEPAPDPWAGALDLASMGDLEGALPLFAKAVEAAPDDAERHETYAKVLYQLEKTDEAAEAAQRAVDLDPQRIDAYLLIYRAHEWNGDLDSAKLILEAANEAVPGDVRVLRRLATLAGKSGDTAGSIAVYRQITEANPQDAEAWLSLGNLCHETGDLEGSRAAYQRVIDLDPDSAHRTYYNLGVLLVNRGDRSDDDTRRAITAFRKAVEIKPDYAQAYQQLGFALLAVNDQPGALEALKSYVRVDPKAPDAARMQGLISTLSK